MIMRADALCVRHRRLAILFTCFDRTLLPFGLLQKVVAAFEEFFKRVRDPRIDRRHGDNVAPLLQLDPEMRRASALVLELDEPAKTSIAVTIEARLSITKVRENPLGISTNRVFTSRV